MTSINYEKTNEDDFGFGIIISFCFVLAMRRPFFEGPIDIKCSYLGYASLEADLLDLNWLASCHLVMGLGSSV